uniref:60S acidic ribosomal protein P1 n=1 Tax=Pinguiococcus pyrenoidosus TaxID=172671 RepID=A0A7R9UBL9_9STRA|mmetsp:Transcript_452/g.1662  ORF Transcript_452/g.1662 Transcript_452/m.1662 type:complete len:121 (+) Transcript_452:61-423(+)
MSLGTTEMAVAYAALALHDGEVEVNSDNIAALLKATGIKVEPYWPMLFGSFLQGRMDDMIMTLGGGGGGPAAAAGGGGGGGGDAGAEGAEEEAPKEEEKEEVEEVDLGGGMDMFGGGSDY